MATSPSFRGTWRFVAYALYFLSTTLAIAFATRLTKSSAQQAHARERTFRHSFLVSIPHSFEPDFVNPCWYANPSSNVNGVPRNSTHLRCIPHVYILGQPKCGTSDLYDRITAHPLVEPGPRKEIRYFSQTVGSRARWITKLGRQNLNKYAAAFSAATSVIQNDHRVVTIDGGPHILWWPFGDPHQSMISIGDLPNAQLLHRIHPGARLIVAIRDPIERAVSDFRFKQGNKTATNASLFSSNVKASILEFEECFKGYGSSESGSLSSSTVRKCIYELTHCCGASDRRTGRLGLGIYGALLEPWFKRFGEDHILLVRLETIADESTRKAELLKIFNFIGVPAADIEAANSITVSSPRVSDGLTDLDWEKILQSRPANANPVPAFVVDANTTTLLRQFYSQFETFYDYEND